jgi:putative sugar O-methyltransferase
MNTSISDVDYYKNICREASLDENFFKTFRSDKRYQVILEHVSQEQGWEYLNHIITKNSIKLNEATIKYCKQVDEHGNPNRFIYPEFGDISPTILRYLSVLGDIERIHGDLKNKKIVEIGAGYGGQSMLINLFHDIDEYVIIDIPEALELIKKFLQTNNIDTKKYRFLSPKDVEKMEHEKFDLLISNYAFSECYKNIQDLYIEKIVNKSKNFYMVVNFINQSVYDLESLLKKLDGNIKIYEEEPNTCLSNKLLVK